MTDTAYRFKKDHPNYIEERRKHLIQLTKDRYKTDPDFREACKARSKAYYEALKAKAHASASYCEQIKK